MVHTEDRTAMVCKFSVYLVLRRVCLVCTKTISLSLALETGAPIKQCEATAQHGVDLRINL